MPDALPFKKKIFFLFVYFLLLIVVGLIGTEIAKIDYKDGPQNRILQKSGGHLIEQHFAGLYTYDKKLGWVPNARVTKEKWGVPVSTLQDGIRSNGTAGAPKKGPLVLAFGGSFTFGDNVADNATWPAQLEQMTDYRVLNAGVSSYGLDQDILRAEELLPRYHPQIVIVSVIKDSFNRARERVRHGVPKPYFMVDNGRLVLKNVPVPFKKNLKLDPFRRIAGYSYFINKFMDTFFNKYWWKDTMYDFEPVTEDQTGLSELLLARLDQLAAQNHARLIVLFQGTHAVSKNILQGFQKHRQYMAAHLAHTEICDAAAPLLTVKEGDPRKFETLFAVDGDGHMSQAGNRFVAQQLKNCMEGIL